jgi:HEAT repeat protein
LKSVVKFLRRRQIAEGSAFADLDLAGLGGPEGGDGGGGRAEAIAELALRKIDILQGRDKKLRLIRSLARAPGAWVSRVYVGLLTDASDEIRDAAVRELAGREDYPLELLHERLRRPPWYARSAVLRILGTKGRPESIRAIFEVVDDPNVDVKRAAARALGEIGGPEARRLLVRLTRDDNPYVRASAVEALEKIVELKFS